MCENRVTIVVDTREQEPYAFDPKRVIVTRKALPAGDYSVEGYEDSVAVIRLTPERSATAPYSKLKNRLYSHWLLQRRARPIIGTIQNRFSALSSRFLRQGGK